MNGRELVHQEYVEQVDDLEAEGVDVLCAAIARAQLEVCVPAVLLGTQESGAGV